MKSKTLELPKLKLRRLYLQGRKAFPEQNPKNNTTKENTDNFNYIKTSVKLKTPHTSIKIRHPFQEDMCNAAT